MTAIAIVLAAYFFPAAVASWRGHRNFGPIMVINLFFGWTLLGWVLALAWSFSANAKCLERAEREEARVAALEAVLRKGPEA